MLAVVFGLIGVVIGAMVTAPNRWYDKKVEDKKRKERIAWKIASRELDISHNQYLEKVNDVIIALITHS